MVNDTVDRYLSMRRAAGYVLISQELTLRSFARYAVTRGEPRVRVQTAVAWAAEASSPARRAARLKEVVRLARHARAEDPAHELPPGDVFGTHRRRPVPYLFEPSAFRALMDQAQLLGPAGSFWPQSFSTLLALLWCTGLRISEALHLRLGDVTTEGLFIRRSKSRKSRLVPLHPTAVVALRRYLDLRRRVGGATDHVFPMTAGLGDRESRRGVQGGSAAAETAGGERVGTRVGKFEIVQQEEIAVMIPQFPPDNSASPGAGASCCPEPAS